MLQAQLSRKNAYEVAAERLEKNPGQWKAYMSEGNFVALAGPGSGKTKVLTLKLARILHEEDFPEDRRIACITYNNECARELERRLHQLGIAPDDKRVYVGTAHSLCLTQILRPLGKLADVGLPQKFAVAPRSHRDALLDECLAEYGLWTTNKHRTFVQASRRSAIDRIFMEKRAQRGNAMAKAMLAYEQRLHDQGLIDFEDMVIFGARIVHKHAWARTALHAQFPVLMVDEYQDLGLPLHEIVKGLCLLGRTRLFAVGDPDQSIYGFTGAYPKLLLQLTKEPGIEHTRLPFNYRCGKSILDTSVRVLGEAREYTSKAEYDGSVEFHLVDGTVPDQAEYITSTLFPAILAGGTYNPGDVAILYRNQSEGKYVGAALEAASYNTVRIGRNSHYEKTALTRWLEDCAAFCAGGWRVGRPSLTNIIRTWRKLNPSTQDETERESLDDRLVHFLYTMRDSQLNAHEWLGRFADEVVRSTLEREPELDFEKESFDDLLAATRVGGPLAELDLQRFAQQGGSPHHVNLLTLHSCKGREFPVVILAGMDEGIVPGWNDKDEESLQEARRLFYVGITRAMKDVYVLHSATNPSRFIGELRAEPSK